jgi:PhzF family phenazine biosynthesis protein
MHSLTIKHVDAFTESPFSGNPACVVPEASGLSDRQMQLIAREMNLSETAFILPPTTDEADIRIRWFTPAQEVDLCGHATVASFHALSESGLFGMQKEGTHSFTLETKSGLLDITVEKGADRNIVQFELPVPAFTVIEDLPDGLLESLSMMPSDVVPGLPSVRDTYAYIGIRSLERLHALRPNFKDLADMFTPMGLGGVCVFSLETVDPHSSVHSRFFCPSFGIDEDPVTGSANGPLGVYLHSFVRNEHAPVRSTQCADGRIEYIGEQGDVLDWKGRVRIRLATEDGSVKRVWIVGTAVTIMTGSLSVKEKGQ